MAFGSMKEEDFTKFVEMLYAVKADQNVDDALAKAKAEGLPIEDN
jgi:hypothetical protein